ncbi:MAG: WecB/TagA/CpsF family glycosyltransferase [Candidatus Sumerlaeia bacterium]|nr:WecB/TagA/CpsF family glycosyltransferase [Candidatus Sumerlaeia bacterium]
MSLFGLPLAAITVDEFIDQLMVWAGDREASRVVGYLNAHTSNLIHRDPSYRRAMEGLDLLYADGMAVVRASARLAPPGVPERVNAGDFLVRFLWAAQARGRRVALVGSRPETVARCAATLREQVPGFEFALVQHGHFALGGPEEEDVLEALAAARVDMVLVGMGSPRQEQWASSVRARGGVPVIWCVGALFEYFGTRRRAPVWMRQAGLEWAFRLALEPRRLARRYLLGNLEFLWRVWRAAR